MDAVKTTGAPISRPGGSAPPPPGRPECRVSPDLREAIDRARQVVAELGENAAAEARWSRVHATARVVLGAAVCEGGLRDIAALILQEFPGMSEQQIAHAANDQIARRSFDVALAFESVFEELSQSSPRGDENKEGD